LGLLDEIKKHKQIEEEKQHLVDQKNKEESKKRGKKLEDKIKTYIPLVEQFCNESGMQYSTEYNFNHNVGEACQTIRLSLIKKESYVLIHVYFKESKYFHTQELWTMFYVRALSHTSHDYERTEKDASVEWVKRNLLEFYSRGPFK